MPLANHAFGSVERRRATAQIALELGASLVDGTLSIGGPKQPKALIRSWDAREFIGICSRCDSYGENLSVPHGTNRKVQKAFKIQYLAIYFD
jgi:hypothetical protein